MRALIFILFIFATMPIQAGPVILFKFDDPEQEATFNRLSNELRCLVCQNQSIADSNADLAKDLRQEIYKMLKDGKSEQEIVDFMVQRYGDYVLYRPPMKPSTWALWFSPVIIFLFGLVFVVRYVRRQSTKTVTDSISEDEIERLKNLQSKSEQGASNRQGGSE